MIHKTDIWIEIKQSTTKPCAYFWDTGSFHDYNLRCHRWRRSWHHDDSRFSVCGCTVCKPWQLDGSSQSLCWQLCIHSSANQPDLSHESSATSIDSKTCNTWTSLLTHWGRDKMAIVSQTLSNAFSWMKMLEFRLGFHWSLFLRFQLTIIQHWFR